MQNSLSKQKADDVSCVHFLDPRQNDIYFPKLNTPPETVPLDRTNGAARPLKWCMVTADMVH